MLQAFALSRIQHVVYTDAAVAAAAAVDDVIAIFHTSLEILLFMAMKANGMEWCACLLDFVSDL